MLKPPSGWSSIFVLTLMLLSVAWLVQALDWTAGLDVLTPVVLLAVLAGTVLGRQLWLPATLAHGWSGVIGLGATLFLGSFALADYVQDPAVLAGLSRLEQMTEVRNWFMDWLSVAVQGGDVPPETARFVFVLWMAMLLWLVSYLAAWFLTRYVNWWGAVLPAGFALLANIYHAPPSYLTYMAFFLLCALVLAAQSNLALQLDEWQQRRISYNPDIGLSFVRDGLLVAVVVLGLSWLAPAQLSQSSLRSALSRFTSQRGRVGSEFNRLFPSLNYPARGGGTSFGNELALGGSISLGNQPVFDAAVDGLPEGIEPRYWRLAVYDEYTGTGWRRNAASVVASGGLERPLTEAAVSTRPVTQTITPLRRYTQQLFAAPQPAAFSLEVQVQLAGGSDRRDMLSAESTRRLAVGETYTAVSYMTEATLQSLRAAGERDPDWIADRYLQLPSSMPERVVLQAMEITRPYSSRYDKADAIEDFLRTYEYSDIINNPPADRDLVDWFLFDERRGYCDYYSSAFVVLARTAGIPARLSAGYATGQLVAEKEVYRQTEANAHTWPEAYLGEYGWIEFEPTASDSHPQIERPRALGSAGEAESRSHPPPEREEILPDDDMLEPGQPLGNQASQAAQDSPGAASLLLPIALAAIFSTVVLALRYVLWQRPLRGLSAAESAFARLVRMAGWIGIPLRAGDTPFEYGDRVAASVPDGRDAIRTITTAYVRERFGRQAQHKSAEALDTTWAALRSPLARAGAHLGLARLRARTRSGAEWDAGRQRHGPVQGR